MILADNPSSQSAADRGRWMQVLLGLALSGCMAPPPQPVAYQPPAAGPQAQLLVRTEPMWAPNRVTLYLLPAGADPRSAARQVVGQLQSGEHVKREVLSFDARLAAGVPLRLFFEYRYDAGSLAESGCDFPLSVTLGAGGRYVVDFIKDTRGCEPRFFVVGRDGALQEIPLSRP